MAFSVLEKGYRRVEEKLENGIIEEERKGKEKKKRSCNLITQTEWFGYIWVIVLFLFCL